MQAYRTSLAIELVEAAGLGALFALVFGGERPCLGSVALGLGIETARVAAVSLAATIHAARALGPARKSMTSPSENANYLQTGRSIGVRARCTCADVAAALAPPCPAWGSWERQPKIRSF